MAKATAGDTATAEPVLPAWDSGCVTQAVPALLGDGPRPLALSGSVSEAEAVVLLLIDGLGWTQLQRRQAIAQTLSEMQGGAVTTVVPSTTATALTSIVTGTPPGEHGIIGYRIDVDGEVLNVLSWSTPRGDARKHLVPEDFAEAIPFAGTWPVVVQNAPFVHSGFSRAHLGDTRHRPWSTPSGIVVEVRRALAEGEPFVYVYYDGLDKTGHAHGLGEHYDAELAACDRLVADLLSVLGRNATLVVTADHGLMDCRNGRVDIDRSLTPLIARRSGEARFVWLHARPGRAEELAVAAVEAHGDDAWVATAAEVIEGGWLGPTVREQARRRLGDVALAAKADRWFCDEPRHEPHREIVGRHGSLTAEEMLVPLLAFGPGC